MNALVILSSKEREKLLKVLRKLKTNYAFEFVNHECDYTLIKSKRPNRMASLKKNNQTLIFFDSKNPKVIAHGYWLTLVHQQLLEKRTATLFAGNLHHYLMNMGGCHPVEFLEKLI